MKDDYHDSISISADRCISVWTPLESPLRLIRAGGSSAARLVIRRRRCYAILVGGLYRSVIAPPAWMSLSVDQRGRSGEQT